LTTSHVGLVEKANQEGGGRGERRRVNRLPFPLSSSERGGDGVGKIGGEKREKKREKPYLVRCSGVAGRVKKEKKGKKRRLTKPPQGNPPTLIEGWLEEEKTKRGEKGGGKERGGERAACLPYLSTPCYACLRAHKRL